MMIMMMVMMMMMTMMMMRGGGEGGRRRRSKRADRLFTTRAQHRRMAEGKTATTTGVDQKGLGGFFCQG
eukprot:7998025-Pyramimonas_sp.AAC.1